MAGVITGRRMSLDGYRLSPDDRPTIRVKGKTYNCAGAPDLSTVPAKLGKKKNAAELAKARKRKSRHRNRSI